MADKPFVINDRRKFTAEGELRPDAERPEPSTASASPDPSAGPRLVTTEAQPPAEPPAATDAGPEADQDPLPPPPSAEDQQEVKRAFDATVDRLDTVMRAANPGAERIPEMTFERFVQSIYMQSMMQLGGATQPGQPAQVDLIGARQSIDMLNVIADKSKGNLSEQEQTLIDAALFEMRMGFLEVTQALSRQAAARQHQQGAAPGAPVGPSLVS